MIDHKLDDKVQTGIAGFDHIAHGGLPRNRNTLVAGTAGSGKSVFGLQFLHAGATIDNEGGVLVAFEESPSDLMQNVRAFGWDMEQLVRERKLAVVDATATVEDEATVAGSYDLSALLVRIEAAVRAVNAKRVVLDSVGALLSQFGDGKLVRRELNRIGARLRGLGLTTITTAERVEEDGKIGRFGVEDFVADNVIVLRNRLDGERRRRTMEIMKLRGSPHYKGEYPFTIDPEEGIAIIPLSAIQLAQQSSTERVSSGVPELDDMCGGGLYRDSIVLVSGATGTGKTMLVAHFLKAGFEAGERVLLFAAEESMEQLARNAAAWGIDFGKAERDGLLKVVCRLPETMGLEDHLIHMRRDIANFKPMRVAIDSMTALERASSLKSFREFLIGLITHLKHRGVTALLTTSSSTLSAAESVTEIHISTMTDTIIILRYIEISSEMRRGLTVLKMRGSRHERAIREYTIDSTGMKIGAPFKNIHGILGGSPTYMFTHGAADAVPAPGRPQ
ncbi:MAG: circadian clock protein KaiC [Hyphomicrobiaceae bacterium]|jgi:circadian clock protein KaiC